MRFILILSIAFSVNKFYAQTQHLIPYRQGDLWGYADTTGKIIIKPEYSKVSTYNKYDRYLVENNSAYGIVDNIGKIIIPVMYKTINRDRKDGYIAGNPNEYYFYDFSGKLITEKPYKSIYYGSKDYLYLITDTMKYKFGFKENKIIESSKLSDEEYDFEFDEMDDSDYSINRVNWDYRKLSVGNKQGISKYTKTEKGTNRNVKITETIDTLNFSFNEINIYNYYKLKFVLFRKGKKWGVIHNDSIQINALYDDISSNLINNNCEDLYFIVSKKDKYGVLDLIGNTVINFEHDEILFPAPVSNTSMNCFQIKNGIVVKNNDKYGIISIENNYLKECKYDTIEYSGYRFYIYSSGNKKGVYSNGFKTGLVIDAYERFGSITSVDRHKLIEVKDDTGKLKGYVNQNDIKFYRD